MLQAATDRGFCKLRVRTSLVWSGMFRFERSRFFSFLVLKVDRNGDVRDAAVGNRSATRQINDILNMRGAHDALVVDADIHVKLVERHILLGVSADQVVELQACDRQHRRTIHLRVVEAIQQVDSTRAGGGEADAEFPGVFGVAAGHECGGFFMPHMNKANFVLARAQRFHDAVDTVSGQPEDHFDTPIDQRFHEHI